MPRGANQLQQERQNQMQEQHQNVQEQVQNPAQQMAPPNFGFEEEDLNEQDKEIMDKLALAAHYLENYDALPQMKAFNDYMKKRINQDWVQKSDEFAKVSANLYRKYENAFLEKGTLSNWEKLEEEAGKALREVQQRDEASRQIRQKANLKDMERNIDELLGDRKEGSDSPAYTAVWEAADAYKKLVNQDPEERAKEDIHEWKAQVAALKNLSSALQSYASLRYKKRYGSFKGRRRMDRVTKLIALTGSILEVEPAVTAIRESAEERKALNLELQVNFTEDIRELEQANGHQLPNRWADVLLPYERNANGEVTEETRANYVDNWETIKAFKTQDDELRLTMVAKLYNRLNKLQLSEKSYEKDNIDAFYKNATASKGLFSLYMIFSSVIQMEEKRYTNRHMELPRELAYMKSVMASEKYTFIRNGTKSYLESYGFKEEGGVVDTTVDKRKNEQYQENARNMMEMAKNMPNPPIDEAMEQALRARVEQLQQQPGYQDALRQELQTRDANWQPNTESEAYAEQTAQLVRKCRLEDNDVQKDLARHLPQWFDGGELAKRGLRPFLSTPTRLRDLMLKYKRGEDGEVTPETRQNYETNLRLLNLFFSEDAEDRIAGIAYIYLRLKKTYWNSEEDITRGNALKKYHDLVTTDSMQFRAYNVILDALSSEKSRTQGNELLTYIDQQTEAANQLFMRNFAENHFCLSGYGLEGKPMKKEHKEEAILSNQIGAEAMKAQVIATMQMEKAQNNGNITLPVAEKEDQLRQLCRDKGLVI